MNVIRIAVQLLVLGLLALAAPAAASADGYSYSYWGDAVPAPDAYAPERIVYGNDLGIGPLSSPQDLFVGPENKVYIADTGNNRIVVLSDELKVEKVITEFERGGEKDAFNQPEGVFATAEGGIYVADTRNHRLVELTAEGAFVREVGEPKSSLIREGFQYAPSKVVVDRTQRIYVVGRGSYEGIMEFSADGEFTGFLGTNRVKFKPIDLLWKQISTKKQRDQMQQFIPLEFNNIDLNEDGFLFTTTSEEGSDSPIKKLNPSGTDILRSKGYFPPKGDIGTAETGSVRGSSIFVDIASDRGGMYSALDSKRGRVFSYDKDGNLLYVFGGLGSRQDRFRNPSAIALLGERTLVLDQDYNRLTVFAPTRYGSLIREAVNALYDGRMEESTAAWRQVLQLNGNFDVAYIGIGKSLLQQGDHREAMSYFKLGSSREYYSEAFKLYRKDIVMEHFGKIVLVIALALGIVVFAAKRAGRRNAGVRYKDTGALKHPLHTMLHPFAGFWEMKFEGKGRVSIAAAIALLFVLLTIVKRQFSGFVVNYNNPTELNSLDELKFIVLPLLLWCVANWSLTTLMDGIGKFKDIMMAAGYSLMPFVVLYVPQILYSNVITADESSFYYLIDTVAYLWFVWLLFVGTMTIHQYTAGKTIATMLLTLVVIGIILFIGVLLFSMVQQMVSFAESLIREMSFRW